MEELSQMRKKEYIIKANNLHKTHIFSALKKIKLNTRS
jgi:hypothetical protein